MIYIVNAFSITMLDRKSEKYHRKEHMTVERINVGDVKRILKNNPGFISAYGHEHSARWLSRLLNIDIPVNRRCIHILKGDAVIAASACYKTHYHKEQDNERPFFVFYLIKLVPYKKGANTGEMPCENLEEGENGKYGERQK